MYKSIQITESIIKKFKPTRIFIAEDETSGLKYLGKTIRKDISNYKGSGKKWSAHRKKYPNHVYNIIFISEWFYCPSKLQKYALKLSYDNQIVESDKWANLIPENGLSGGYNAKSLFTKKAREKAKLSRIKKYGDAAGQMRTKEAMNKKYQTKNERYGHQMLHCHTSEAKKKRKVTQVKKFGSPTALLNTPEARKKAANTHSNNLSKKKNRKEVKELQRISKKFNIKLPKNYWQMNDEKVQKILIQVRQEVSDSPLRS